MTVFKALPKPYHFADEELRVLELWDRIDAFNRSISQRKAAGATPYSFYDGPPFATGLPHYGHIVASSIKDTVARYWTMRGHFVERRFGWDTHGLPIEMETEKALGLLGPQSIREYGVGKFNEACRAGVFRYTEEWRRVIGRIGRWVDFDNDYKTLDRTFMESVWWVFKRLWDDGLVYQGFRVMPYSVRLSTPLSNFEANLNYQEVQDPSVTVAVKLVGDEASLLIWTTTPWTLPSNLAIAVGPDVEYLRVRSAADRKIYYVAKALAEKNFKDGFEVMRELKGRDLVGKKYEPIYGAPFLQAALGEALIKCHVVIPAPHVTTSDGTGLVHMAPAFGQEDFDACQNAGLPFFDPLNEEGIFTNQVPPLAGLNFKDADKVILHELKDQGKLFARSTMVHSYPFCWRSNTPLMYKAMPVWFVNVPKIKERMVTHNDHIHWVPEAVGHKRFKNWLKDAADWSISRNRFWGTPIPVWQCTGCEHQVCLGSALELEELTGKTLADLHSHFIDELTFSCAQCSKPMKRIVEVFDCWFESGSMPYAQVHYPFENKEQFEKSFPADFIAEGLDQTRGWFYTLLVIATALFDKPPFKNVVVNGMVLASDGTKMSKSKKNFPDPEKMIEKFGADAMRVYLLGSPVVRAEPLEFHEQGISEVVRSVMLPLYNAWSFFVQYALIDGFDPKTDLKKAPAYKHRAEIDSWILSKLQSLIARVNSEMSGYYLYKTTAPMLSFIDDLTNWYIRRCRRRFWKSAENHEETLDKLSAYATLYEVLVTFSKVIAPLFPFMSESMYQSLVVSAGVDAAHEDSVHLTTYPEAQTELIDHALERDVEVVRHVVAMGRALREKHRLKTRQPLKSLTTVTHEESARAALKNHEELILSELNVRELSVLSDDETLCTITARPNFKSLGPKAGKDMNTLSTKIAELTRQEIYNLEQGGQLLLLGYPISLSDIVIIRLAREDVVVMNEGSITVALDTELDENLKDEGLAREILSQLQRLRKAKGLEITDRIHVSLYANDAELIHALNHHEIYLASELLATTLSINDASELEHMEEVERIVVDGIEVDVILKKA